MFFLSPSKRRGGSASGEAISWLLTLDYLPSTLDAQRITAFKEFDSSVSFLLGCHWKKP